ncbi:MAG TPA: hypothetical protein VLL52_02815 [Anaerolineae bacterium]|nr:hypothetical protein [Anaerolineae bacterium]
MSDLKKQEQSRVNRREFLKVAGLTAMAATATGTGAAVVQQKLKDPTTVASAIPPSLPILQNPVGANPQIGDLLTRVTALQAENMQLRAQLNQTQTSLTTWQKSSSDHSQTTQTLQIELNDAYVQLGVLSGLLSLYERLDNTNFDETVVAGLTTVNDAIAAWQELVPDVDEALVAGHTALNNLEAHLPSLQTGVSWLDGIVTHLETYMQNIETALAAAVEVTAPIVDMIQQWFTQVLDWLPFGLGQQAKGIMGGVTALLGVIPSVTQGLKRNISQPLRIWLGSDEEEGTPLQRDIVTPLRTKSLMKAKSAVVQGTAVSETYKSSLADPVAATQLSRQAIQATIAQYREVHGV